LNLILVNEGVLRSSDIFPDLLWVPNARAATISDVLRVHEWSYVRLLQSQCERASADVEKENGIVNLDGDTTVSHLSYSAAMHAAGAVCEAVDLVMQRKSKNVFCPVRKFCSDAYLCMSITI
jgi:acetoin utilization deacetylase AcuC-like enzyme